MSYEVFSLDFMKGENISRSRTRKSWPGAVLFSAAILLFFLQLQHKVTGDLTCSNKHTIYQCPDNHILNTSTYDCFDVQEWQAYLDALSRLAAGESLTFPKKNLTEDPASKFFCTVFFEWIIHKTTIPKTMEYMEVYGCIYDKPSVIDINYGPRTQGCAGKNDSNRREDIFSKACFCEKNDCNLNFQPNFGEPPEARQLCRTRELIGTVENVTGPGAISISSRIQIRQIYLIIQALVWPIVLQMTTT